MVWYTYGINHNFFRFLSQITRLTYGRTDGRTDKRTNRHTDRQSFLVVSRCMQYMQRGKIDDEIALTLYSPLLHGKRQNVIDYRSPVDMNNGQNKTDGAEHCQRLDQHVTAA